MSTQLSCEAKAVLDDDALSSLIVRLKEKNKQKARISRLEHRTDPMPLSAYQEQIYYHLQASDDKAIYNVPLCLTIQGKLDTKQLLLALNSLLEKHEVLRTSICILEGRCVQQVNPHVDLNVQMHDMSDGQVDVDQFLRELANQAIDLESPSLMQINLLRLSDTEHRLLINIHHIIFDGWSVGVLLRDLENAYNQVDINACKAIDFIDYVAYEEQHRRDQDAEKSIQFWQEQLAGKASHINLPTKTQSEDDSSAATQVVYELDHASIASLERLAQDNQTTLNVLFLSGLALIINKFTDQQTFQLGLPINKRNHEQLNDLIGFFVNTIIFGVDVNDDLDVKTFLHQVHEQIGLIQTHSDIAYSSVVKALDRQTNQNNLFQLQYVFQNATQSSIDLHELSTTVTLIELNQPKFDLSVQVLPGEQSYQIEFEYNARLFEHTLIERLMASYVELMQHLSQYLTRSIRELDVTTQDDFAKIEQWNRTQVEFESPKLLHQLFEEAAKQYPEQVALVDKSKSMSYRELDCVTNQVAHFLMQMPKTKIIGLYLERDHRELISILGTLKCGAAYLPIDKSIPAKRFEHITKETELEVLITQKSHLAKIPPAIKASVTCLTIEDILSQSEKYPLNAPKVAIDSEDMAYIIYTSGSTGNPKGVVNSHRGIVNYINARKHQFDISRDDTFIHKTPYVFDVSVWEMLLPLSLGAKLIVLEEDRHKDTQVLIKTIQQHAISVIHFVPSMLEVFMQAAHGLDFKSLRQVYVSGEKLTSWQADKFQQNFNAELINLYGPTEAAIDVTAWHYQQDQATPIPIGQPLANIQIYILNKSLQPMPIGAIGEICIAGAALAQGYYQNEQLSNEKFIDTVIFNEPKKIYRSGDLGRYREDGHIEILGRYDDQVKIRGLRIELDEITHALLNHPEILQAVTIVNRELNQALISYYLTQSGCELDHEEISAYLSESLPEYMLPNHLIHLQDLPLLVSGKVDKKSLPRPDQAKPTLSPSTDMELQLYPIWCEILNLDEFELSADFFSLGGHSLLAIQLIDKINQVFNRELSLLNLLKNPTLIKFARFMSTPGEAVIEKQMTLSHLYHDVKANPSAIAEPFELNLVQQAYWVGKKSDLVIGNTGAHFYCEIVSGFTNANDWNRALNTLLKHHPMLRATVDTDGFQRIHEQYEYHIHFEDVSQSISPIQKQKLDAIRHELAHKLYDSTVFPLFDIVVIKVDEQKAHVFFSFDLLICDAHSIYILLRDLARLLKDAHYALASHQFSFRDYVLAKSKVQSTLEYERAKSYWTQRLDSLPLAPELHFKTQPSLIKQPRFKRKAASLSSDNWQKLQAIAKQYRMTPSAILLTCFAQVLSIWSNQDRFTINLTLFNRIPLHDDVEKIVGDFTTVNLLEVDLSKADALLVAAMNIQQQLWMDLENRLYSGIQVLRDISINNADNGHHLMPIVFTSTLTQDKALDASVINELGTVVDSISQTPQVYLDHQVYVMNEQIHFHWDYVDGLFHDEMIDDMFARYCQILDDFLQSDDLSNLKLDKTAPVAHQQKIESINQTQVAGYETHLHHKIVDVLNAQSERGAITHNDVTLSYHALSQWVAITIDTLIMHKIKQHDLVAIYYPRGWQQTVLVLALNIMGAAYLPIDSKTPPNRVELIMKNSKASAMVASEDLLKTLGPLDAITCTIDTIQPSNEIRTLKSAPVNPADLAYVIYTSGSTGQPKGVAISHQAAANTISDINQRFNVNKHDSVFAISSLGFDLSVYDIYGLLSAQARLVIADDDKLIDPAYWYDVLCKEKITIWNSVPTLVCMLMDYIDERQLQLPPALRLIMMSGDWIPVDLPQRIRHKAQSPLDIISMGGATEASIWSIIYPIDKVSPDWKSIPYGKPLDNQQFYVLNQQLEYCPTWVAGELYIGGVGLADGYWQSPEKTNHSFIDHPKLGRLYRTFDLGRYLPDGNIEFLGRADRQVKVRGYRIELEEIEKVLLDNESIKYAVVTVKKNESNQDLLVAYLVSASTNDLDLNAIKQSLAQYLPDYMCPDIMMQIEQLPFNKNGKVDIAQLPQPVTSMPAESKPQHSSTNETITRIVHSVLNRQDIQDDDNLLEFGVTSVDVVRIANKLEQELGKRFQYKTFFQNPSLAGIKSSLDSDTPQHFIHDLSQREAFKARRLWHRQFSENERIALPPVDVELPTQIDAAFFQESSTFSCDKPISLIQLSKLLKPLQHVNNTGPHYASFGISYPVQTYVYLPPETLPSIQGGVYYYDSVAHELVCLQEGVELTAEAHVPFVYRPLYQQSQASIFLVANLDAIEPLYGEASHQLCQIESGNISYLLQLSAYAANMQAKQVGAYDFEQVKNHFHLTDRHRYLISLLIGSHSAIDWEYGVL